MQRWRSLSVLVLVVTAIYLYAFPSATIFYAGTWSSAYRDWVSWSRSACWFFCFEESRTGTAAGKVWLVVSVCGGRGSGIVLIRLGTAHRFKTWLYAHIALVRRGRVFLAAAWLSQEGWLGAEHGVASSCDSLLLLAGHRRNCRRRLVGSGLSRGKTATSCSNPRDLAGDDGARRRRPARQVLPQFRANHGRQVHPLRLFPAIASLRTLPRRHLQAVGKLDAPFFFVQQSVVPQKH